MEKVLEAVTSILERSMRKECKKNKKKNEMLKTYLVLSQLILKGKTYIIFKNMKMVRIVK